MANVTAGNKITAGQLTTLINRIKTEFAKRANPYTTNRLNTYGSGLALSPKDSAGTSITAN